MSPKERAKTKVSIEVGLYLLGLGFSILEDDTMRIQSLEATGIDGTRYEVKREAGKLWVSPVQKTARKR